MSPIRVAVVADILLTEMGGVARSVRGVVDELVKLDPSSLEVTVVARARPDDLGDIAFRRSAAPWVPRFPGHVFAFQRPLTLRDFDVVHYMDSRPPLNFGMGPARTVVTQHGFGTLLFGHGNAPRRWIYLNKALVRVAPQADFTITASESELREVLARAPIPPDRIAAIHHGVDHDRFRPLERDAARRTVEDAFGLDGRYVLYISNHQRKKNTERLVEAFAQVAAQDDDVQLVLTGWHTPRFALVEELIDLLQLRPRVRVLGHVPDETLPALYTSAEVFVMPSLHEGFGLPVLEAMACGTPVVAANAYSLPEVSGDAAELIDPYDVDDLARGILRLLEDRDHASELRRRGLERAKGFTWRRSAERHLECYEHTMSLPRSRRRADDAISAGRT